MYVAIFFASVFVAAVSQILMKKSAMKTYDYFLGDYLNPYVIVAYALLFLSMFMTIFAYKGVGLKTGPAIESTSYIYVAVLSAVFLRERISKKKLAGLLLIMAGVLVSTLM